jgi:hypothetical protein
MNGDVGGGDVGGAAPAAPAPGGPSTQGKSTIWSKADKKIGSKRFSWRRKAKRGGKR